MDPTSYAPFVGGLTPALEIVLDEAAAASREGTTQVAVVVAASRIRHPLDARTLARLAAQHVGEGAGSVVGFGLSNDERRGQTADFAPAFAIARRAGLALVPHAGELLGPTAVESTLEAIRPDRIGHGVRSVEDPRVLEMVAESGVALDKVCPRSNVALGVYGSNAEVPLRTIVEHGIPVALGSDDPLFFGSRLADQYPAGPRRPRLHRRRAGHPRPRLGHGLSGPGRGEGCHPGRHRGLAHHPTRRPTYQRGVGRLQVDGFYHTLAGSTHQRLREGPSYRTGRTLRLIVHVRRTPAR